MKRWLPGWVQSRRRPRRTLDLPAPAVLALLFLGLIALGTLLLKLPIATEISLTWLNAAFTATSAVTVTGLGVLDTGADLTRFGQCVVLVLIQLGGLGLMTFAVLVFSLLGQRIGLRQQLWLREDLNQTSLGNLVSLSRQIGIIVVLMESLGTVLLALRFVPELGWGEGLFSALFHAVSAFNNAGFALYGDSLTRYATDPLVNAVITVLIIIGGLGFVVIGELRARAHRRWSLHTHLVLAGTAVLLLWSFLAFLALEWNNPATLGQFAGAGDRFLVAWFQAVTTRTAGFNTVDMAGLNAGTVLMFISLMFIGGGSTSTAGGIKVGSFAVLVVATLAFLRGRQEPTAFGRRILEGDILKVLALTFISLMIVMIGTFLLTVTHEAPFLDLAFEVASAFGTVGLSRGVTAQLNPFGEGLIMLVMFIGRVGPLALGFMLATAGAPRLRRPPGRVYLG